MVALKNLISEQIDASNTKLQTEPASGKRHHEAGRRGIHFIGWAPNRYVVMRCWCKLLPPRARKGQPDNHSRHPPLTTFVIELTHSVRPHKALLREAVSCLNNLGRARASPRSASVREGASRSHFLRLQLAGHLPAPLFPPARVEKSPSDQEAKYSAGRLLRQIFHLLGQLASSPRKTSWTGFLFLCLRLLGWGERLSLGLGPPLPSLAAPHTRPDQSRPLERAQVGGRQRGPAWMRRGRSLGLRPEVRAREGAGRRDGGRARAWSGPPDAAPMTELQQDVEDAKSAKVLGKRESRGGAAQWVFPARAARGSGRRAARALPGASVGENSFRNFSTGSMEAWTPCAAPGLSFSRVL